MGLHSELESESKTEIPDKKAVRSMDELGLESQKGILLT